MHFMTFDLKTYALKQLEDAKDRYLRDLAALPDIAFSETNGGASRAPASFTYEIICVNSRFVKRLKGEDPGPFDPNMWAEIPADLVQREGASEAFTNSMSEVIEQIQSLDDSEMLREIQTPGGTTSPFDLALFCGAHVNYHDGQINYIQAIRGDAAMHWQD